MSASCLVRTTPSFAQLLDLQTAARSLLPANQHADTGTTSRTAVTHGNNGRHRPNSVSLDDDQSVEPLAHINSQSRE